MYLLVWAKISPPIPNQRRREKFGNIYGRWNVLVEEEPPKTFGEQPSSQVSSGVLVCCR